MTDVEESLQAMLDANPHDHATRLILADHLAELGDDRADGYRALGEMKRVPLFGRIDTDARDVLRALFDSLRPSLL